MTNGAIETVLWPGLRALEPTSQLGGILADKPGYHNSRDRLPSDDYSVREFAIDRVGPADLGSAIDWTFPEAQTGDYTRIQKYGRRLLIAGQTADPRMYGVREYFGQSDSDSGIEGWDYAKHRASTSDRSHLWHIHKSIHRKYINDGAAMRALLSVLSGQTLAAWRAEQGTIVGLAADTFSAGSYPSYDTRFPTATRNFAVMLSLAAVYAYDATQKAEAARVQAVANGVKLDTILSKLNSWDATSGILDQVKRDTNLTQIAADALTKDPRIVGYDSPIALNAWWAAQHPEGPTE